MDDSSAGLKGGVGASPTPDEHLADLRQSDGDLGQLAASVRRPTAVAASRAARGREPARC